MIGAVRLALAGVRLARTLRWFIGTSPAIAREVLNDVALAMRQGGHDMTIALNIPGALARSRAEIEAQQREVNQTFRSIFGANPFGSSFDPRLN